MNAKYFLLLLILTNFLSIKSFYLFFTGYDAHQKLEEFIKNKQILYRAEVNAYGDDDFIEKYLKFSKKQIKANHILYFFAIKEFDSFYNKKIKGFITHLKILNPSKTITIRLLGDFIHIFNYSKDKSGWEYLGDVSYDEFDNEFKKMQDKK